MDPPPSCTRSTIEGHKKLLQKLPEAVLSCRRQNQLEPWRSPDGHTKLPPRRSRMSNPTPCRPHLNQMADGHKPLWTRSLNNQSHDNSKTDTMIFFPQEVACQIPVSVSYFYQASLQPWLVWISVLHHCLPNDPWTKGCPQQDLVALLGVVLRSLGITWWQSCLTILSPHFTLCITLRTWFYHQTLSMMHQALGC